MYDFNLLMILFHILAIYMCSYWLKPIINAEQEKVIAPAMHNNNNPPKLYGTLFQTKIHTNDVIIITVTVRITTSFKYVATEISI